MNTVVQILDTLEEAARGERTDGQLIDRFVRHRDQDAFASVVRRHGPMVLGVCRRVLRNSADADDAFQAAFIVLARKASTLGTPDQLAPWLHGVAYNTARKLQRTKLRRAVHESALELAPEPQTCAADERAELLGLLDEELNQLPERYRAVVVLCDLEGLTRRAAAQRLGCPEGTVAGRLARARSLLAARLTGRGVTPVAGLLVAALSGRTSALSPVLLAGVVRAVGMDDLVSATAQGLISSQVANTTEGVLKSMFVTKLRTSVAAVLCCGLAVACAGGAWHLANAQPAPKPDTTPPPPKPAPNKPVADAAPADAAKRLIVIPLKKLRAKQAADEVTKLLPETVTVAAVRDENALLVYASEKGMDDVRLVLRTLGEELPKEPAPAPAGQKTFLVYFDKANWDEVLDWYSKETGLTLITAVKPTGTLTLKPNKERRYTIAEVTDLLNEAMMPQGFILIRRHLTFFIHAADEKLDPTLIPRVSASELAARGKSEIVECELPLENSSADLAGELNKLLTPFGSIVLSDKFKYFVIRDTVGNVERILATLPKHPHTDTPTDSLDYVCKWRSATTIAKLLETLLADKNTTIVWGRGPGARDDNPPQPTPTPNARVKTVRIAVDSGRNAIIITAPQDTIAVAKQIIEKQDTKPSPDAKEYKPAPSVVQAYNVPAGTATELAHAIQRRFPGAQVVALPQQNQILVIATADEQKEIARAIPQQNQPPVAPPDGGQKGTVPGYGRPTVPGYGRPEERVDPSTLLLFTEKTCSFRFEKAPWHDVFVWYARETGLRRVGEELPTGTFTFAPPKPDQTYTLTEMTDILNETLLAQKWLLIRGEKSFTVVPADEKVDPKLAPVVELNDLAKRGRTEYVAIRITAPAGAAADFVDPILKLLSPFGQVEALPRGNVLVIRGTAGNLQQIVKTLGLPEAGTPKKQPEEK